ncbi:MAG: alpha/beta fold hydrolase [Myxococcales bacterium]
MDREKLVFSVLKPADMALGAVVGALRTSGALPKVTDSVYSTVGKIFKGMYEKQNDLRAEGLENVPTAGGVLFASNHQSWNDVQVIAASSPRRIRFLAKAEFLEWPILRHLIALSDSPYIKRGGDREGMAVAIQSMVDGKAMCIFPEGTIPGEEDKMRHDVEPDTGLLPGHTGAVRLAIGARVPIVPIGVTGTGASFPPEVYPRLEILEAPKPLPVVVRYGKPIYYDAYHGRDVISKEELRALTKDLMKAISSLVDHERGYVPVKVPSTPLPTYGKVGVLLLHGFTSNISTVDGLVPLLEERGMPYRMPILRGHGTRYQDMAGVTARDWYNDAEVALLELASTVDKVLVVGLSMGGLVALDLAIRHPDRIAGVVTLAAALRFQDPLVSLSPVLARVVDNWPSPNAFNDELCKAQNRNYPRFMTDAFVSLVNYAGDMEKRLSQVKVPICLLQSKRDTVVDPIAANLIYRGVSSEHREIHWFTRSGHEMGQDMEAAQVFRTVMGFLQKFQRAK